MTPTRPWTRPRPLLIAAIALLSLQTSPASSAAPGDAPLKASERGTSAGLPQTAGQTGKEALIVSDTETGIRGLDLERTLFSKGAIVLRTEDTGTGMILNKGESGEIYGGVRFPVMNESDKIQWFSIRAGRGGFRVLTNDGRTELLAADTNGGIYLNGDLFVNGKKVFDRHDEPLTPADHFTNLMILAGIFMALLGGMNVALIVYILRHHIAFRTA